LFRSNVKQTKDVSVKTSNSLTKAKKVKENPLDAGMLKMASEGYSAEEIGEAYGVPAAQAAQRIRDILQSRDWLTEIEQQKLNIMNLRKIQGRIRSEEHTSELQSRENLVCPLL